MKSNTTDGSGEHSQEQLRRAAVQRDFRYRTFMRVQYRHMKSKPLVRDIWLILNAHANHESRAWASDQLIAEELGRPVPEERLRDPSKSFGDIRGAISLLKQNGFLERLPGYRRTLRVLCPSEPVVLDDRSKSTKNCRPKRQVIDQHLSLEATDTCRVGRQTPVALSDTEGLGRNDGIEGEPTHQPLPPANEGCAGSNGKDGVVGGRNINHQVAAGQTSRSAATGFNRFWETWPAHVNKCDQRGCASYWQSEQLEQRADQIIKALAAWKLTPQWQRHGGRYIPTPLNWLRDEKWSVPLEVLSAAPDFQSQFNGATPKGGRREQLKAFVERLHNEQEPSRGNGGSDSQSLAADHTPAARRNDNGASG